MIITDEVTFSHVEHAQRCHAWGPGCSSKTPVAPSLHVKGRSSSVQDTGAKVE